MLKELDIPLVKSDNTEETLHLQLHLTHYVKARLAMNYIAKIKNLWQNVGYL